MLTSCHRRKKSHFVAVGDPCARRRHFKIDRYAHPSAGSEFGFPDSAAMAQPLRQSRDVAHFLGHGNLLGVASQHFVQAGEIEQIDHRNPYPLISATCFISRWRRMKLAICSMSLRSRTGTWAEILLSAAIATIYGSS